jgi:cobalt-zinc-cadmium efflux system protein
VHGTRAETTGGGNRPTPALTTTGHYRKRLAVVLAITVAIAVGEVVGGLVSGSLVLLADAAHMAADAAGVGLSLLAVFMAARPATDRRTFGYARTEILAAMANALLLFGMTTVIIGEGIRRLSAPPEVSPGLMIVFGVVALAGNGTSLVLLRHGAGESMNVRGAFLEVASDTFGAAAVIVTGVAVATTGSVLADPIASVTVAALILPRTWRLLRDAIDVLLEASPRGIELTEVRAHMTAIAGVEGVHDLHAWTITSGLPVLSAHVVVDPAVLANGRSAAMLEALQGCLRGHFDLTHSTFQLEPASHAGHEPPPCL